MDERSERMAERFARPLMVAAVLTIPVTILQLLPPPDPWRTISDVLNWMIWLAFVAEVAVDAGLWCLRSWGGCVSRWSKWRSSF